MSTDKITGSKIELLDHGFLRLVDMMGTDLSIVRNARVSYDADWRAGEDEGSDSRLINYLYKNGHNTPFEAVTLTFEVKAPIFVLRQWMRHRTWAFNELSARYKELPEEFYVPKIDQITTQSPDNKQMRTQEQHELAEYYAQCIQVSCEESFITYRRMIDDKIPRELARSVLPVATYSHMFATVNLNNLFKFLGERLHPHAQYEIRVYAAAMLGCIERLLPVSTEAFKKGLGEEYEY